MGLTSISEFDQLTPRELKALVEGSDWHTYDLQKLFRTVFSQSIFKTAMVDTTNAEQFQNEVDNGLNEFKQKIIENNKEKSEDEVEVETVKADAFAKFFARK
ncbi:hypothetical protein FEZ51_02165 [Pediococcus stilesii]|uniref:Uncharacterized protein n=1 Tax=Pediococcus stilesii TaxID=331679 RepID=A0A5R9BXN0_9LACO|nr:hypothetical protein [Pediococcus stilesii]TLQ05484.1 hypothetical protein FEZ51_02165 [Pediococcus stilesii]